MSACGSCQICGELQIASRGLCPATCSTGATHVTNGSELVIISCDGQVHRLHAIRMDLTAHTWVHHSKAVALSCACKGGQPVPLTLPATPAQLESLFAETAAITIQLVMSLAEAAYYKDGQMAWGGTSERWDLLKLKRNGPFVGGEKIQRRIQQLIEAPKATAGLKF